jgi:hypothetical protein
MRYRHLDGPAQWLRRETTMTLVWMANRLQMDTHTCLAHLLYWQ